MRLTFLGCGDAFGSGGRFNTCFFVEAAETRFLIDCGASSLIAMKQHGVDPNAVDTMLITHLYADHFGGLPFFMLDAQFNAKRTRPLTVAGPPGLAARLPEAMEVMFPGSSKTTPKFDLSLVELEAETRTPLNRLHITPYEVNHDGLAPFYAYRIEADGKVLAYSGDAEWRESLIQAGREADLFVCEAYFREKRVPMHLDLKTLESRLLEIRPKRLVLTHMTDDMLAVADGLPHETAADGKVIEF
ncbi:MAG: MBL fold metallo-hydrolase [Alphaproteobacteria bacterium]|nr:MBL fold metallo-hydrolase [Alphaproteobacteria bacterium]